MPRIFMRLGEVQIPTFNLLFMEIEDSEARRGGLGNRVGKIPREAAIHPGKLLKSPPETIDSTVTRKAKDLYVSKTVVSGW